MYFNIKYHSFPVLNIKQVAMSILQSMIKDEDCNAFDIFIRINKNMKKCHVLIILIFANIRKSNSMSLASIREKKPSRLQII